MTEPREAVIFETADLTELQLAQNLVQEEGIPCRVISSGASAFLGAVLGPHFGGFHQLLVPLDCEERAEKVLADAWEGRPEAED